MEHEPHFICSAPFHGCETIVRKKSPSPEGNGEFSLVPTTGSQEAFPPPHHLVSLLRVISMNISLALRDLNPKGGAKVGAIAGAAAGSLGVLVERLHCPLGSLQHGFAGHLSILPLAIILGVIAGAVLLKPGAAAAKAS